MKAILTVNMDNAAFEDAPTDELASILAGVTDRLLSGEITVGSSSSLRDINGNRVGELRIEGDPDEDRRSYEIVRYFERRDGRPPVILSGLTLEEAQAHCNDPETSSATATSDEARRITETSGPWFEGYREEG